MKKIIAVLIAVFCLGTTVSVAAPAAAPAKKKFVRSQLVQGPAIINYQGVELSVPKGQTILIGRRENGSYLLRGETMKNIRIDETALHTKGYSVLSYRPGSHVVFLNRGEWMTVIDPSGRSSTVAENGAISTTNAAITSDTAANLKAAAEQEEKDIALELGDELNKIPAFVEATATTSAAVEQAVQDVEETLSASAPR